MSRKMKVLFLSSYDAVAIIFSSVLSFFFLAPYIVTPSESLILITGLKLGIYLLMAIYFRLFRKINRYTSIREALSILLCVTSAYILAGFIVSIIDTISFRFMVLSFLFSVALIIGSRICWRIYNERKYRMSNGVAYERLIRTLVVGAGQGGSLFVRSLQRNNSEVEIIGFIDDDITKQNVLLYGVPVIGMIKDIPNIVKVHNVEQITVAIPSMKPEEYERFLEVVGKLNVTINQMPSLEDVMQGKLEVNQFREIDVVDLLGREEVKLDMNQLADKITGKTVLVSGAGGSIGSEICRQIARFSPSRIVILGHGENSIYLIHKELQYMIHEDTEIVPIIADIQDRNRIFNIMKEFKPNSVYHAAAHKHVPLMEYNPIEAVKNNIYGTKNMAEAAKAANVTRFVMISTDKAVNPPNVMGSTKRIAEMIVTGLNEPGKTVFSAVRFGNVLGSRGSVVPLFKEQIKKGGPITVTDFRMTRYFMTIPEASRLVIQAGALAQGGEVFILDMAEPVKIVDLAKKMIKLTGYTETEIPIVETGIRPGEKLYEELLTSNEHTDRKVYDKIFVGKVSNRPIEEVMNFVRKIEQYSAQDMRTSLVSFACKECKDSAIDLEKTEEYKKVL
ncbi:MAG: nucleoside-diphosphate sugar epimerase/dehydratase [Desemzia incerta]|uniref:nucleoside-diphosphate sugar epimerase/dehydratase n=1 Tax=Desemzia incerta TaxID=82801 RepID=UPI00331648BD